VAVELQRHRFTVERFHQMTEAGIFGPDDRIELMDGEIVEMSPIYPPHSSRVGRLTHLCVLRFGDRCVVSIQGPLDVDAHTEAYPDVLLLRPRDDFYAARHPRAEDVLLVVEVSDTTVRYDTRVKAPRYAAAGIADYWLVNLRRNTITVFRDPGPTGYGRSQVVRRGESIRPLAFPDDEVAVAEILG
jgi:Uma2 family endonuclease